MKTRSCLEEPIEPPFLSALHAKNDTTNIFGYKLGESTENNEALLFFSGKERIQTLRADVSKYRPEVYKTENSKILKKKSQSSTR